MNNINVLKKYNIKPVKYKKLKNVDIITTSNNKYVIKHTNNHNIYEYLKTRNFDNIPIIYTNNEDNYEITGYINSTDTPIEQKIEDLIYLTSILHLKTSFNKNIDSNKLKDIYELNINNIDNIYKYYLSKQDNIELEVFMSPSNYFLIRNISNIYYCLNMSKKYIEKWYEEVKNKTSIKYVMNHGNLKNNHLLENDNIYLISWDKARVNSPINDLINLYINNYKYTDINNILKIYETNYKLEKEEKYYLYSLLLQIPIINEEKHEYDKMKETLRIVDYTNRITSIFTKT